MGPTPLPARLQGRQSDVPDVPSRTSMPPGPRHALENPRQALRGLRQALWPKAYSRRPQTGSETPDKFLEASDRLSGTRETKNLSCGSKGQQLLH